MQTSWEKVPKIVCYVEVSSYRSVESRRIEQTSRERSMDVKLSWSEQQADREVSWVQNYSLKSASLQIFEVRIQSNLAHKYGYIWFIATASERADCLFV